jgi:hypothetical protein
MCIMMAGAVVYVRAGLPAFVFVHTACVLDLWPTFHVCW